MKVLIYLAGATIGPSVGIHLEEAIKQIKQGNGVFILHCDSSIGGCMEILIGILFIANCALLSRKRCSHLSAG